MRARFRALELLIFDKDGTLYCGKEMCEHWSRLVLAGVGRVAPDLVPELKPYLAENVHQQTWAALQAHVEAGLLRHNVVADVPRWIPPPLPQRLYPRVRETLDAIPCATALLTADNRSNTEFLLRRDNLRFDVVVCGDDPFPAKPHPHGAWHILKDLGIQPGAAAIVGDSQVDMDLKATAGLGMSIQVATRPVALRADVVLRSVRELVEN